jgi:pimeloyl-ACP methyl ester carboxylesterase
MPTVTSKDGTQIGYNTTGTGPAVILIDGAFCFRGFGPMPALAPLLAPHFTIYTYDRRGRGESGDTLPFALEREFEDIDALIQHAGGAACLFGTSSGAALALRAAASGLNLTKLAMYEPPYDNNNLAGAATYTREITDALAVGSRGDAVAAFIRYTGAPPEAIEGMRQSPMWAGMEAVAPTLAYDNTAMGDSSVPTALAATVSIPTLVMTGSATFPFMHASAHTLVNAMPNAEYRSLEGQTHEVDPSVLAPVLIEFFSR